MAGTIAIASASDVKRIYNNFGGELDSISVMLTCTADASAATYPDATINSATTNLGFDPDGMYLTRVEIVGNTGGTEPTSDSDLYLYHKSGGVAKAIDILDGNGVDQIDNDQNRVVYPAIDGQPAAWKVTNDLTVTISGNSVNSAVTYITLVFEAK